MAKFFIETRRKSHYKRRHLVTFLLVFIFLVDIHRFGAWVARNIHPKKFNKDSGKILFEF
jgi:hypothetical protein